MNNQTLPSLLAVSDGTGTTAELVARAALAQFDVKLEIEKIAEVRDASQLNAIILQAAQSGSIIVHTLVSETLRKSLLIQARENNVIAIDLIGPLLARLSDTLHAFPRSEPGVFTPFAHSDQQRIEALDFVVEHDNGKNIAEIEEAEIILIGVPKTGKTPLSIYLAYRGWKVSNIPIALGMPPPKALLTLKNRHGFCLTIDSMRLTAIRSGRKKESSIKSILSSSEDYIQKELAYANEFYRELDWPMIDITHRTVEEVGENLLSAIAPTDQKKRSNRADKA